MKTEKDLAEYTLERYRAYIEKLYSEKDSLRREEFISKTAWKDFVPVIEDDTARFLQLILEIRKPMKILEIGTSIGFSATSMALTAKKYGGDITTIEFNKTACEQAEKNFVKSGVDKFIKIVFGDAAEVISKLPDQSFDLVFQDIDNRLYSDLFADCMRVLKQGGIFIADDTLFPVIQIEDKYSSQIEPIKRFNQLAAGSAELISTLLPIGDGITIGVKRWIADKAHKSQIDFTFSLLMVKIDKDEDFFRFEKVMKK